MSGKAYIKIEAESFPYDRWAYFDYCEGSGKFHLEASNDGTGESVAFTLSDEDAETLAEFINSKRGKK